MIKKEKIIQLAEEKLSDGMFLVDVTVSKSNVINVYIDSMDGVTIDECITISRNIEGQLDRDIEDFELQVSSSGLGQPFKVIQQYKKNIGNKVAVVTNNGESFQGEIKNVNDTGFELEAFKMVKAEGKKKKEKVVENHFLSFEDIKTTKAIISFK